MKLALLLVLVIYASSSSIQDARDLYNQVGNLKLPLDGSLWVKIQVNEFRRYTAHSAVNGNNNLIIVNEAGLIEGGFEYFEITCDSAKAQVHDIYQFIVSEMPRDNADGHIFIPPTTSLYSVEIV